MTQVARIFLILTVFFLWSCSTVSNNSLKTASSGSLDLAAYDSFSLVGTDAFGPEVNQYFDEIIAEKFIGKGLVLAEQNADLTVTYILKTLEKKHLSIHPLDVNGVHPVWVAEFYGGIDINVIENKSDSIVWSGAGSRDVTQSPNELNKKRISSDLDRIFSSIVSK